MPQVPKAQMFPELPGAAGDQEQMMQAIQGATHGGVVPMQPGGHIQLQYPSLRSAGHVDWQRVNPRLLEILNKEGEKRQSVVVLHSGYRDHGHNSKIGGHPASKHKIGTAVDAFLNGHPIGEVIGADELAKLGVAVGGPNGHDLAHVEIRGIPLKMPPKQTAGGGDQAAAPPPDAAPQGAPQGAPQLPTPGGDDLAALLGGGGPPSA